MSEPTTRVLTQDQLDLIASNKAKALERLRAKRKANEENGENAPKKAKWIKSFYEYDLSTFEDSKAGFIVDDSGNKKFEEKKKSYVIEPYYRKYLFYFEVKFCCIYTSFKHLLWNLMKTLNVRNVNP